MKGKYYNIKAINNNSIEIAIYGEIYSYKMFESDVTAFDFRNEFIAAAKNANDVTLRINSPGGDVFEGNAIISTLLSSGKRVNAIVDGVAASMAAIIALSADTIKMPKNAMLMLHAPSSFVVGNANELREQADVLDQISSTFTGAIAKRTGLTDKEVSDKYFNGNDNWFTADEALSAKLIDGVENYDSQLADGVKDKNLNRIVAFFDKDSKKEKNKVMAENNSTLLDTIKQGFKDLAALVTGTKASVEIACTNGKMITFDDPNNDGKADVGDNATIDGDSAEDGDYTATATGETYSIEDGVVTKVMPASSTTDSVKAMENLTKENTELKKTNNDLTAKLQSQEKDIKALGEQFTAFKAKIKSTYQPEGRENNFTGTGKIKEATSKEESRQEREDRKAQYKSNKKTTA